MSGQVVTIQLVGVEEVDWISFTMHFSNVILSVLEYCWYEWSTILQILKMAMITSYMFRLCHHWVAIVMIVSNTGQKEINLSTNY